MVAVIATAYLAFFCREFSDCWPRKIHSPNYEAFSTQGVLMFSFLFGDVFSDVFRKVNT